MTRTGQQGAVGSWERSWEELGEHIRTLAHDLTPDLLQNSAFSAEQPEDVQVMAIAEDACGEVRRLQSELEKLAQDADMLIGRWREDRDNSNWAKQVGDADTAYGELKLKLADEGAGDPAAYERLVQEREGVEQRPEQVNEARGRAVLLEQQAQDSATRLGDLRRELSKARSAFLQGVLDGNKHVQISLVPYGARDSVEAEIRKIIERASGGFEKDIGAPDKNKGLLAELYADTASVSVEQRLREMKAGFRAIAAAPSSPGPLVRDQRFAAHMAKLHPEVLDRLDIWFPTDSLDVKYSASGDGRKFRSIEEGSPGQKTAALLAFLLSYGGEPLILDQPEDDLDNHLIYDLIVSQIRSVTTNRQLIIVTHNPNIVVNGDAEQVVALRAAAGQTHIESDGSLQDLEVRRTVCTVMEGGRAAFERRYRRIFLETDSSSGNLN